MSRFRPHGPRIVCVAVCEREFPEAVRRWLNQADLRPYLSPDVYDALAMLATGARPVVMVVSSEAVDWNEMEFFGQVQTLSPGTRIYATGREGSDPKVQAAVDQGARPFDPAAVQAELDAVHAGAGTAEAGGLVAGSLRSAALPPQAPIDVPAPAEEGPRPETSQPAEPVSPSSPIRLVASEEEEAADDVPVSVPWVPHPSRPKRTPPKSGETPSQDSAASDSGVAQTEAGGERMVPRVELTPDEIAALLGKRATDDAGSVKEQRS